MSSRRCVEALYQEGPVPDLFPILSSSSCASFRSSSPACPSWPWPDLRLRTKSTSSGTRGETTETATSPTSSRLKMVCTRTWWGAPYLLAASRSLEPIGGWSRAAEHSKCSSGETMNFTGSDSLCFLAKIYDFKLTLYKS